MTSIRPSKKLIEQHKPAKLQTFEVVEEEEGKEEGEERKKAKTHEVK